jgi:hypothetical protein
VVATGARRRVVEVPGLARVAVAAAPEPPVAAWPPPRPEMARRTLVPVPAVRTWSTARAFSAGFAVAGVAALGAGVYFGVHASSLADRADQRCPGAVCGDPEGLRLNDQAQTSATRANVLYIAGGAALATAAVLWLVGAPGEVAVVPVATASAGAHPIGLAMTGRF